ncbi:uncharacterized protein LOC143616429 [Bidens hawaiensis]|uniref:uncharacterized protein LOC143616429 n=1 Tax=Bidens hawaiensis TaxID=980011 RepID=UPI00404AB0FC
MGMARSGSPSSVKVKHGTINCLAHFLAGYDSNFGANWLLMNFGFDPGPNFVHTPIQTNVYVHRFDFSQNGQSVFVLVSTTNEYALQVFDEMPGGFDNAIAKDYHNTVDFEVLDISTGFVLVGSCSPFGVDFEETKYYGVHGLTSTEKLQCRREVGMSIPIRENGVPVIKPSIDYLLIESSVSVHFDWGKWGPLPIIIVLNTLDDVVIVIDIGAPTYQIHSYQQEGREILSPSPFSFVPITIPLAKCFLHMNVENQSLAKMIMGNEQVQPVLSWSTTSIQVSTTSELLGSIRAKLPMHLAELIGTNLGFETDPIPITTPYLHWDVKRFQHAGDAIPQLRNSVTVIIKQMNRLIIRYQWKPPWCLLFFFFWSQHS